MRTIKAKAGGLANLYGSALAALLLLAVASLAAQPLPGKAYRNAVASLSPGMPAATGPALPTNRFEISLYTIESGESEKDSIQYTTQLFSALARRNGWASEVEPSNENILKTRKECVDKNAFCDVVGVTEDYAESRMTLTLTVLSVPQSHGDLHKARIEGKEYKCNPSHCTRDGCRTLIMQQIVEDLAGMDKDHKSGRLLP